MPKNPLETLLSQRASFLHFLERRVGERALAEDILQAAYIRALESGPPREEGATLGWFYQVLRNAIIDHYRHNASESAAMERFTRALEGEATPAHVPEPRYVCGCIETILPALRPAYAEVLREVDLAEKPLTEFAAQHQLTPGNAAVRAHRARAALRSALQKFCGACSVQACLDCICKTPASIERA